MMLKVNPLMTSGNYSCRHFKRIYLDFILSKKPNYRF